MEYPAVELLVLHSLIVNGSIVLAVSFSVVLAMGGIGVLIFFIHHIAASIQASDIVDMALKALSPGINDTTTAAMCVDYLSAILARLAPRPISSSHRYVEGELRVIAKGPNFESLLAHAFDQIRRSANGNVTHSLRDTRSASNLAGLATGPRRRRALSEQIQQVAELAARSVDSAHDRAKIEAYLMRLSIILEV